MSLEQRPENSAAQQEGDVLELTREQEAPPAPEAEQPSDEAAPPPKPGEAPGILFDEEEAARVEREKKKLAAQQPTFEVEEIESVLEQYLAKHGEEATNAARTYIETLQKASNDKFVFAKRAENSAQHAADDLHTLVTRSPVQKEDDTGVSLKAHTEGATIHYSAKGVQYNGPKKSFTEADAELLALHAKQRADLMPPAKVWLTGTAQEKKLIADAIAKVNLTLPAEAQIVVGRTVGDSLLTKTSNALKARFGHGASGDASDAPATQEPATDAKIARGAEATPEAKADASPLGASFPDAAAGKKKDENFIGPQTPEGWQPRAQTPAPNSP